MNRRAAVALIGLGLTACASPQLPSTPTSRLAPTGRILPAPHITCLKAAIEGSRQFRQLKKDVVTVAVGDANNPAGTAGQSGSVIPTDFKREIVDVLSALGFVVPALSEVEDRSPLGYRNRDTAPFLVEVSLSGYEALVRQHANAYNGAVNFGGGRGGTTANGEVSNEFAEGNLRAVAQLSRNARVLIGTETRSQFHVVASAVVSVPFRMWKVKTAQGIGIAIGIALGNDRQETIVFGPNIAAIAGVRMAVREVMRDFFEIPAASCRGSV